MSTSHQPIFEGVPYWVFLGAAQVILSSPSAPHLCRGAHVEQMRCVPRRISQLWISSHDPKGSPSWIGMQKNEMWPPVTLVPRQMTRVAEAKKGPEFISTGPSNIIREKRAPFF